MNYAQFREWLENEFNTCEPGQYKDALSGVLFRFKKIPDVAAELEQVKQERDKLLGVINQLRNRQGKSKTPIMLLVIQLEKEANKMLSIIEEKHTVSYYDGAKIMTAYVIDKLKELSK